MINRYATAFRLALMAADGASGMFLFAAVSAFRLGPDWVGVWRRIGVDPAVAMGLYAVGWATLLGLYGLYRLRARWTMRREALDIFRAGLAMGLGTFTVLFAFHLPDISRILLLGLFSGQVIVTFTSRVVLRALLLRLRARGENIHRVLVVGVGDVARSFANQLEMQRELGLRVVGHLAPEAGIDRVGSRPVLGRVDDLLDVLHSRVIDEVVVCLPPETFALAEPIVRICQAEGKIVRIPLVGGIPEIAGGAVEDFGGVPLLSLVYGPDRALALLLKRSVDLVLAALALFLLAPVFFVIGLAILLRDRGPVFFRQTRVGLHGRPFEMVKFRTMVPDAEARFAELDELNEVRGPAFKVTDDPRLTRTGPFLRRTSLDELPQLWNVLRGEMSIVGPRPPLPGEVAGYDLWHRRRLSMRPGMTGLWQVSARREEDFDRWVAIDLDYIDRWSLWLDLRIMLGTIPAVISGSGR